MGELLKAAKRVVDHDTAKGLPHEDMAFADYNEWVAALHALKEAVERAEERALSDAEDARVIHGIANALEAAGNETSAQRVRALQAEVERLRG